MGRGKGIARRRCFCRTCGKDFWSTREDALTCSARCRKARNRLLGGPLQPVTEKPAECPVKL